jgi:hypothetical protein
MATRIAVTDANIFIDVIFLEIEGLLPDAGFVLHTTRQVMDELNEEQSGKLRALIALNRLEVHGILWLLNECVIHHLLTKSLACEKLSALMLFNPRLPLAECDDLLRRWASQ